MNEIKRTAIGSVDSMAELFENISDKIWDEPELSLKEFKSVGTYIAALKALGFAVEEELCGIKTAFSGSYGSGRPVIGILAEYDALSGLSQKAGETIEQAVVPGGCGHGCGHNLLGAGALAAAAAVKKYLELSGRSGTVVLYGCPGEEGGSGKAFMAREGLWYGLDAALTWHPGDANEVRTGTNNSCIQVLYKFSGVAAHAASHPHDGRSALDAVELMNVGVQFLREHMTSDCRVHYAILDGGGVSPNVVQSKASVLYMARANKVADSVKLLKRIDKIAAGAALMTETEFERVFIDGTAELVPNYTLEDLMYKNFLEIGPAQYDEADLALASALKATLPVSDVPVGVAAQNDSAIAAQVKALTDNNRKPLNDFICPIFHSDCFVPGSTDVGDVSWQTPTAQIQTACWPSGTPGHSWQAVSSGKSGYAHKAMLNAAKVIAASAIDLYEDDALLSAARSEFKEKTASGYVCPIEPDAVPIAL